MNCSRFETLLTDYLEKRLEPPVQSAAREHLAGCEACGRTFEQVVALHRALSDFPELKPPADLVDRILLATSGRPRGSRLWRDTVWPTFEVFMTRRFAFATILLFVFLSLMVNLTGPPVGAVLKPGGLVESADRLTGKIARHWAQILNVSSAFQAELLLLKEDLSGRLDYHLVSQLFENYEKSIEEQQATQQTNQSEAMEDTSQQD